MTMWYNHLFNLDQVNDLCWTKEKVICDCFVILAKAIFVFLLLHQFKYASLPCLFLEGVH